MAEISGFWTVDLFFSGDQYCFFFIFCVVKDIVCYSVPPNSASFVGVPQVVNGVKALL